MCCRDGLDKQPKKKTESTPNERNGPGLMAKMAFKNTSRPRLAVALEEGTRKRGANQPAEIETVDLADETEKGDRDRFRPREYRKLDILHSNIQAPTLVSTLPKQKPKFSYAGGIEPNLSFMGIEQAEALMSFNSEHESIEDVFPVPPLEKQPSGKIYSPRLNATSPSISDSISSSMGASLARLEDSLQSTCFNAKNAETLDVEDDFGDIDDIMRFSSPATLGLVDEELPEPSTKPPPTWIGEDSLFVTDSLITGEMARKRKWDYPEHPHSVCHYRLAHDIKQDDQEDNTPKRRHIDERKLEPLLSIANPEKLTRFGDSPAGMKDQVSSVNPLDGIDPELLALLGDCIEFID
jgi:hypothetical protein